MNTIRGMLHYDPNQLIPLKITTNPHEFDLWKKVESAFWALAGHHVICEQSEFSFLLILNAETDWVFGYESHEEMRLLKPGTKDNDDIAARLNKFFRTFNGKVVTVEADNVHFLISAAV